MKLKQNSLTANLYKWFYVTENLPMSLCPYFWKLVFLYLVLIPYTILTLPVSIIELFVGKGDYDSFLGRMGFGILLYVFLVVAGIILIPFSLFFIPIPSEGDTLYPFLMGSLSSWTMGIIFGIGFLINFIVKIIKHRRFNKKYNRPNISKVKENSVIIEFIKASYNKYCPKIDWI